MASVTSYVCVLVVVCFCTTGSQVNRLKRQACSPPNMCNFRPGCNNGGTCQRDPETCKYYCVCPPGYTGLECESEVQEQAASNSTCTQDPCLSSPCSNGGTCSWNETSCTASCTCITGYSGNTCDEGVTPVNPFNNASCFDQCVGPNICLNGGTCITNSQCVLLCQCPPEYAGDLCESRITTSDGSTPAEASTTTARPFKDCGGGLMCQYGKCKPDSNCECDKQHIGTFCHIPCLKNCSEHGICDKLNRTSPEMCNCEHPYTGEFCLEIIKQPGTDPVSDNWKYWVVGSCVILLVLLSLLLLLAYILLRRRNIFIMQVLYYFQPYEDDDGKEFDAFISYKSSPEDENFVYHTLYPELEKERGFKLCLHHRDFQVGETIANNIIWAIENSRRTILVLSPRYMESDFTRFEYQLAHNEMLKQKHKVIPLLLEDIGQQKHLMDNTLTSILKSITYIEWPNDSGEEPLKKFWKRLELSLPKKRPGSELGNPESDTDKSVDNPGFEGYPVELEMIAVENENKILEISTLKSSDTENSSKEVSCDNKKVKVEESDKPMNKQELKSFFDEPVDDELFNKMREKAFEYEQTLNV